MGDGTKRLLLGIDVSIFGVILAFSDSGGAIAIIVGLIGLVICGSAMIEPSRS